MSGSAGEYEVQAYVEGLISLPALQRDLLAMAAREIISENPLKCPTAGHVAVAPDGDSPPPPSAARIALIPALA